MRLAIALGGIVSSAPQSVAEVTYRTVALSGQTVSGIGQLSGFGPPSINNDGVVAFEATAASGTRVLLRVARDGAIELIATEGGAFRPGFGNTASTVFRQIVVNDDGDVGFVSDFGTRWLAHAEGGVTALLTIADAPGVPTTFGPSESFDTPMILNRNGWTAVQTGLTRNEEIDSSNDLGMWVGADGNWSLTWQEGAEAPRSLGCDELTIGCRHSTAPVNYLGGIDASGRVVFFHEVRGESATGVARVAQGIYAKSPGGPITLLIHELDRLPETLPSFPAVENFRFFMDDPSINGLGHFAFGDNALWIATPGVRSLAYQGQEAPGTDGAEFSMENLFLLRGWTPLALSDSGVAAFLTSLEREGEVSFLNNVGLWSGTAGGLQLIARTADPAPDSPSREIFSLEFFGLNAIGHVAYVGRTLPPPPQTGIWGQNPDGEVEKLVQSGEAVPVGPGDARILTFLDVGQRTPSLDRYPSGGSDGRPRFWNNAYEAAFAATFEDDSQAVLIASLPHVEVGLLDVPLEVGLTPPGTLVLKWPAATADQYTLECSDDMQTWQICPGIPVLSEGMACFTIAPVSASGFYRLRQGG